jgi:hypothetical protein
MRAFPPLTCVNVFTVCCWLWSSANVMCTKCVREWSCMDAGFVTMTSVPTGRMPNAAQHLAGPHLT